MDRAFRIIAFDWDGTAVESRSTDASPVKARVESLLELGVRIVIITGTNFNNIDRQFCRLVQGPRKTGLYVLTNRGSEVFGFDQSAEPLLIFRRQASYVESQLLTRVAEAVRDHVRARKGPDLAIVYDRLNRRKIDLIPEPEWANPPKSRIDELMQATERRLRQGGIKGGIAELLTMTEKLARDYGLPGARITTDLKFIEVGLTDKADSVAWVLDVLAPGLGAGPSEILVAGDEFGTVSGFEGTDYRMVTKSAQATFVSVGREPGGVPPGVLHIGGGPERFLELLDRQVELHRSPAAVARRRLCERAEKV